MPGAASIFGGRLGVPSSKSAEEWGRVPVGVRERAFWSAKVAHAQHVADLKAACLDALNGARVKVRDLHMHRWTDAELEEVGEDGVKRGDRTILMTRETVVGEMRKRAMERGLTPTGPRPLEDIAHESRLRLIGEMAEETARERARFERGNDREVLFMWPAQELVRDEYREHPRDWGQRWQAAAESVGWEGVARNGEWIARKDSPIWIALSRFGQPFPPFDYNSGMGTRDVERDKAVELGLVEEGEEIANPGELFREQLGASVQGMGDTEREWLKRTIEEAQGGEVRFTPDGRVEWTPPAPEVPPPSPTEPPRPDAAEQVRLRQTRDRLVEQLRAKQAELEAEGREEEAAEREAQRREGEAARAEERRKEAVDSIRAEAVLRAATVRAMTPEASEAYKAAHPVKTWQPSPDPGKCDPEAARGELEAGASVPTPLGVDIQADKSVVEHWVAEGKPEVIVERLKDWERTKATIRDPDEIWRDDRGLVFLKLMADANLKRRMPHVFVYEKDAKVGSWYHRSTQKHFEQHRKGRLVYTKPPPSTGHSPGGLAGGESSAGTAFEWWQSIIPGLIVKRIVERRDREEPADG